MYQNYGFERYINRNELRNTIKYIVQKGDSLYEIAKKYNVSVSDIVSLNNLASSMIYPNQILFIPSLTSNTKTTLKTLLQNNGYNTSNYSKEILDIEVIDGQSLKNSDKYYTILESDTLDTILSKSSLSPYELLNLNKDNWFSSGNKIIIK